MRYLGLFLKVQRRPAAQTLAAIEGVVFSYYIQYGYTEPVSDSGTCWSRKGYDVRLWDQRLALYDELVDKCPRFERKGKTVPYTSANGHMFSLLNKEGELGMRFSKDAQAKYIEEFGSTLFKSHGAVMRGYVLIPDSMLEDLDTLAGYLDESYDYVMSLDPK